MHPWRDLGRGGGRAARVADYYAPDADGSVAWDSLGIDWGLDGAPVLSDKDRAAPAFGDWTSPFHMEGAA